MMNKINWKVGLLTFLLFFIPGFFPLIGLQQHFTGGLTFFITLVLAIASFIIYFWIGDHVPELATKNYKPTPLGYWLAGISVIICIALMFIKFTNSPSYDDLSTDFLSWLAISLTQHFENTFSKRRES